MKIDFKDTQFKIIIILIIIIFSIVNFYSLLAGAYIALLPISLQLIFLFLFAINHEYQKYIGYLIFGFWFIAGFVGLTGSCAASVNQILSDSPKDFNSLKFMSIFRSTIFLIIGSLGLIAINKQKVKEFKKSEFLEYFDYTSISIKIAFRDAVIIRIVIFILSIIFGIMLALIDRVEIATEYSTYINLGEYILLLIFTAISVILYGKSQIIQSIIISIFNLILLMLIKFDQASLLLSTSYLFILSGIIASIYSLVWVKLTTKPNTAL